MTKVLYVHIPKAGGSAVNAYFAERFGNGNCFAHAENRLQDSKSDHSKVDSSRFVSAHLIYPRLRQHFSGQDRFTMTVIRTPMDQVTSHLAWMRYQTEGRQKRVYGGLPDFLKQLANRMSKIDLGNPETLERFLGELEPKELSFFDNCQTRYLVPYVNGPMAPGMVARAKRNLQALQFVGISERMQDVFDYLSWHLRLSPAEGSRRVNESQHKYGLDASDPALREVLRPYVALDEELYKEGCRLFGAAMYEAWSRIESDRPGLLDRKMLHRVLTQRSGDG
ncbi:MAG: hypothetical protein WD397_16005 [Wenzhouxiangellaceae bacterium]